MKTFFTVILLLIIQYSLPAQADPYGLIYRWTIPYHYDTKFDDYFVNPNSVIYYTRHIPDPVTGGEYYNIEVINTSGSIIENFKYAASASVVSNLKQWIRADASDNIYIINSASNSLHKINNRRETVLQIPLPSFPDKFELTGDGGMLFCFAEGLFVKYSTGGDSLWSIGFSEDSVVYKYKDMHIASDGNIYAVMNSTSGPVLLKISPDGSLIYSKRMPLKGQLSQLLADSKLNLYVFAGSTEVYKYSPGGELLNSFSGSGSSIIIDNDDNIYKVDVFSNSVGTGYRINKFNSAGGELLAIEYYLQSYLTVKQPAVLAVDKSNNLYIASMSSDNRSDEEWRKPRCSVVKFNSSGVSSWVYTYGAAGTGVPMQTHQIFVLNKWILVFFNSWQFNKIFKIEQPVTTSAENSDLTVPYEYSLSQNYPNPFNPVTAISYSIPGEDFVSLKVYDVIGSEAATLVEEVRSAGTHTVEFNASSLPSGIYFYTLTSGSYSITKKLLLLK